MRKIFIATSSFASFSNHPLRLLNDNKINFTINELGRKLVSEEIKSFIADCDGVIAGTETYDKELLGNLPNLKIISRLGVGMENIDLDFAKKSDIKIYKTRISLAPAVAELTLGLIINLLRKISYQNKLMQSGKWLKKMGLLV